MSISNQAISKKLKNESEESVEPVHIPKTMHMIWVGKNKIPEEYLANIRALAEKCHRDGYTLSIWVDSSSYQANYNDFEKIPYLTIKKTEDLLADTLKSNFLEDSEKANLLKSLLFENLEPGNYGAISDFLRILIAILYGGIYLDTDTLLNEDCALSFPDKIACVKRGLLHMENANNLIISTRHNAILILCLKNMIRIMSEAHSLDQNVLQKLQQNQIELSQEYSQLDKEMKEAKQKEDHELRLSLEERKTNIIEQLHTKVYNFKREKYCISEKAWRILKKCPTHIPESKLFSLIYQDYKGVFFSFCSYHKNKSIQYPALWNLTIQVGPSCLQNAINEARKNSGPQFWEEQPWHILFDIKQCHNTWFKGNHDWDEKTTQSILNQVEMAVLFFESEIQPLSLEQLSQHLDLPKFIEDKFGTFLKVAKEEESDAVYFHEEEKRHNEALMQAASYGQDLLVETLLNSKRINPDACDQALEIAAERGHLNIVKRLLQDPRINIENAGGAAIVAAAINGKLDILKCLFQDPRIRADNYHMDDDFCNRILANGHAEIVKYFLTNFFQPGNFDRVILYVANTEATPLLNNNKRLKLLESLLMHNTQGRLKDFDAVFFEIAFDNIASHSSALEKLLKNNSSYEIISPSIGWWVQTGKVSAQGYTQVFSELCRGKYFAALHVWKNCPTEEVDDEKIGELVSHCYLYGDGNSPLVSQTLLTYAKKFIATFNLFLEHNKETGKTDIFSLNYKGSGFTVHMDNETLHNQIASSRFGQELDREIVDIFIEQIKQALYQPMLHAELKNTIECKRSMKP